ncbi:MAG: AAA family ATPase [Nitrococcus sp.]|nr:AAA family ATPase [Nitrococcus sp.]
MTASTETDDLEELLRILPQPLQSAVTLLPDAALLEIVLDLGRRPQARLTYAAIDLVDEPVTRLDLERISHAVGPFTADNRAGIEGTLHRVAAIRNRTGTVVGLTLRVGRAVFGTIDAIHDLIADGRSLLLLGPPGIGKTTRLREIARVLADQCGRRVMVVDTSNEIAGDGDLPHPGIGNSRRMQVPHPDRQHRVMIEAVENHMPEVIIVDEIGTTAEAAAARTIAERGVQLIGTAHGTTLENLVLNPTLADLVGGVQTVTLSDEEARARGTQKTVSERRGPPTFDAVVEIVDRERLLVHRDTGRAVDAILRGLPTDGHCRGADALPSDAPRPARQAHPLASPLLMAALEPDGERLVRIYPYAISRDLVEKVIRDLRLNARTVSRAEQADLALALRARAADPRLRRLLDATSITLHQVKRNSTAQIRHVLRDLFNVLPGLEEEAVDEAAREAELAAQRVLAQGIAVELAPRPAPIRKMQHRIAMRYRLHAESSGNEPERGLVLHPGAED